MARPSLRFILEVSAKKNSIFSSMTHVRLSHVLRAEKETESEVVKKREQKPYVRPPYEEAVKEKEVKIKTGGHLYADFHREKRFWKMPKGDLEFHVKYIDTGLQDLPFRETPFVLALHGSPGSYKDFDPIISHLYHKGARVLSPLFPGSDNLEPTRFRHTPEEKSEYVKDFLRMVGATRVDLLICHSSSLFPGLLLCRDRHHVKIEALCLLNPTAFDKPKIMRPYWLYYTLIRLYEFETGQKITDALGQYLSQKPQLKGGRYQDHFLSAFNMVHSSIPQQRIHFERLLKRHFPVMLAYGEDDKLIARESSLKMAKMMAEEDEIIRYDKNGKIYEKSRITSSHGVENPMRKVLAFENGSHFVFKRHPDVICNEISAFLFRHFVKNAKLIDNSLFVK